MRGFAELIDHCTSFTLDVLDGTDKKLTEALEASGATPPVAGLQMVQLQWAIFAVGMFSIFDAMLQDRLNCAKGFKSASEILQARGEHDLEERFGNLRHAINVLKHGRGSSYDILTAKARWLPFRLKLPDEVFFFEGDVGEVSILVEVDDQFVRHCADVIRAVSASVAEFSKT